jgi:hypothetical protein
MALETNHPKAPEPKKGPQAKDTDAALPKDHDTTGGDTYGTTEGVKESDEQFEQVLVSKKQASNVDEPKPGDVDKTKNGKK